MCMMGGASIIASFLDEGEIDEFMIHIVPEFICEGIPLIAARRRAVPLKLIPSRSSQTVWSSCTMRSPSNSRAGGMSANAEFVKPVMGLSASKISRKIRANLYGQPRRIRGSLCNLSVNIWTRPGPRPSRSWNGCKASVL